MPPEITSFDVSCLAQAIQQAKAALEAGNYPVGAVLAIDDEVTAVGNNTAETSGSYVNHAETALVIHAGRELLQAAKAGQKTTLYSTLEPCLMCLGTAVMNKIDRIIYVQSDPLAGACGLDRSSLGVRYHETWPRVIHATTTGEPKALILDFLKHQIEHGARVEWSKRFMDLLERTD